MTEKVKMDYRRRDPVTGIKGDNPLNKKTKMTDQEEQHGIRH